MGWTPGNGASAPTRSRSSGVCGPAGRRARLTRASYHPPHTGRCQDDRNHGSAYSALAANRLLDTRSNGETLGPNSTLNLTVTGGSVPADATAVALNVTATDTTAAGYLTVYPAGGTRPQDSNVNWAAGRTDLNLVIVQVGAAGAVTFYNALGRTDVLADWRATSPRK